MRCAALLFGVTALVAQDPVRERPAVPSPLPVVVRGVVFDAATGPGARLAVGNERVVATPRVVGSDRYLLDGELVDLRPGAGSLDLGGGTLAFRAADRVLRRSPRTGEPAWSLSLAALGCDERLTWMQALPLDALVLLPRTAGGLVAIRRQNGATAWTADGGLAQQLVASPTLVFAVEPADVGSVVRALSLRNGAQLFEHVADAPIQQVVPAPHGVALVAAAVTTVLDPEGPERFRIDGACDGLVATSNGFCGFVAGDLLAWDRDGAVRWRRPAAERSVFQRAMLIPLPSGDLLVAHWSGIADSGVQWERLGATDGEPRVAGACEALGIGHSKYRHEVYVRVFDDRAVFVSQASGGEFVELVDLTSGANLARH